MCFSWLCEGGGREGGGAGGREGGRGYMHQYSFFVILTTIVFSYVIPGVEGGVPKGGRVMGGVRGRGGRESACDREGERREGGEWRAIK